MYLHNACEMLGWPRRDEILNPTGAGATIFADLVKQKLGKAISRLPGGNGVEVGVLASDPDATEAPIAIVCEFPRQVPARTLLETQKLAWNFCRSLLLITIEPHLIRKWSCFEKPVEFGEFSVQSDDTLLNFDDDVLPEAGTPEILPRIPLDPQSGRCLDEKAAESLQWVELLSGHFFQSTSNRFPQDQRADRMLLSNLKEVRGRLRQMGLEDKYSHDLLARIIFVQFLFDRKDSNNKAALDAEKLQELYELGILSALYTQLPEILTHYEDTYSLFQWLNQRFNGDLFPGKGITHEARAGEWQEEKSHVQSEHLELLASFVIGDMEMQSGQKCLWPQYAFDAIPLEFISSIYEEFVSREEGSGVHYTPGYLVDFILDRVLPWNSEEWNLKILDPACGSGIFLVKAYQRLIYRWKYAHRDEANEINSEVLRHLLEENLFGVDKDPNAVRVASFSLYLAMCDEIDPRYYWSDEKRVRFPVLRDRRIVRNDFFSEDGLGFRTNEEAGTFDLVIGNPPWGDSTMDASAEANAWAEQHQWRIANKDIGILFVAKSVALAKKGGRVCIIQSASALLYNREETAVRLRRRVFTEFKTIEGVVSLSAFRFLKLFKDVTVPACVLILRNEEPSGEAFWYECPKPLRTSEDFSRITIEPHDVHLLYPGDIEAEPWIWSLYMWGSNRDRNLIRRLNGYPSLEQFKVEKKVKIREGINRGSRHLIEEILVDKPWVGGRQLDDGWTLQLAPNELPINSDPESHRRVDTDAFLLPQLIVKTSWVKKLGRFRATFIDASPDYKYVFCTQSFVSIHAKEENLSLLKAACLCYNSSLANYYLLLTSGRFAFYRPEPLVEELCSIPLPVKTDVDLGSIKTIEEVDRSVSDLFEFSLAETILIEDLDRYTLPDYQGSANSPGHQKTHRYEFSTRAQEPELQAYCDVVCRVLKAAYGKDKFVGATIFAEQNNSLLPVRMVSIHLNASYAPSVRIEPLASDTLRKRLSAFYEMMKSEDNHIFYQRSCRTYENTTSQGETVIVVNLIKPDQIRYWTRSMALRDTDAVVADLMMWQQA